MFFMVFISKKKNWYSIRYCPLSIFGFYKLANQIYDQMFIM